MIFENFERNGTTDVFRLFDMEKMAPIHGVIADQVRRFVADPDAEPIEVLNQPLEETPTPENWIDLVQTVNRSPEYKELIDSPELIGVMRQLFKGEPERFPICFFNARFNDLPQFHLPWHQDQASWYLAKDRKIANATPIICWISLNRSTPETSMEIALQTHQLPLMQHGNANGLGYFSAHIEDEAVREYEILELDCKPGEAVVLHPLTLHRTSVSNSRYPRYSLDLRFHDPIDRYQFSVAFSFRMKRIFRFLN